jgi:hypothetical protein
MSRAKQTNKRKPTAKKGLSKSGPVDLSKARRKKIQDRKKVIKRRKNLPPKGRCETFTSYSSYLKLIRKKIDKIQALIEQLKELADEQDRKN